MPLEHNTEANAQNRFLQTERSPAPELDLSATHHSRSPVQQGENSELGSIAWMPGENGSIRGDQSSVWPAGSCNQQPVSTYTTSPLSHPVQIKWTIPSIREVLKGAEVGSDIPFVSRSNRE